MSFTEFDIIGDIHGEFDALCRLLEKLGYFQVSGVWQHKSRKVIFLGDFIDRGPSQRPVLDLVIPMVERGHALAVMGNHEFNALAFHTRTQDGAGWLRSRTDKNIKQHIAFLNEYLGHDEELNRALEFFKSLPLWLDIGDIRVVHACWDDAAMDRLSCGHSGPTLTDNLLRVASTPDTQEFKDVELLLKGKELALPEGMVFHDKDGNERGEIRVKWWDASASTYRDAYLGPESARSTIPDIPTNGDHLINYPKSAPVVFLGHYWMSGDPHPLSENVACVDYSIAKPGGKLVAYRWNGEPSLMSDQYAWVERK